MKVLVTGGSGFLGKRLKLVEPKWMYLSSSELDLTKKGGLYEYLKDNNIEAVINLAAKTGGIKDNVKNQSDFYYYNSIISKNVLRECYEAKISRVLSCLSTCCYPDVSDSYPMKEEQLLDGEPTETNYGYALAKRELYRQTNFYRNFYNLNYSTFTPCNLYGPEANFDDDSSHFIASLIKKIYYAKNEENIELYGSGKPTRQHLYIDDLAKIIPKLLYYHNSEIPINVAPKENLSIKQISNIAIKKINKNLNVTFNNNLDGQIRKDVDNSKLLNLLGDISFTSLEDGIKLTYDWYVGSIK